jgi:hypothetical protein
LNDATVSSSFVCCGTTVNVKLLFEITGKALVDGRSTSIVKVLPE